MPLWILEIHNRGGPTPDDYESLEGTASLLGHRGDVLMFGGSKKKGEIADLFNKLAKGIAIMAWCPGGIRTFGMHFEAPATAAMPAGLDAIKQTLEDL